MSHSHTPFWPSVVGAVLMAVWGAAQAAWMPADGDADAIARAAARLSEVPREIGAWTATDLPYDSEQSAAAGAAEIVSRTYRHRTTGQAVNVLLVCGRPSKIAVHPPTACYRGIGYEPESEPRVVAVDSEEREEFAAATFQQTSGSGSASNAVEVLWAWSSGGPWQAPGVPRITFAGEPVLWKLYVSRERPSRSARRTDDGLTLFAGQLIESLRPVVRQEEPGRG